MKLNKDDAYFQEKFVLERRKVQIEFVEKMKQLEKEEISNPKLLKEEKTKLENWYGNQMDLLSEQQKIKLKFGKATNLISETGSKVYNTFGPYIDYFIENVEDFMVNEDSSEWNCEARDVDYMEKVKQEIEQKQFNEDFEEFKSKKCKTLMYHRPSDSPVWKAENYIQ